MTLTECPVPDCGFTGSEEAVRGHWGGMRDDAHSGNYHEAREAYDDATNTQPTDPEGPTQDRPTDDPGVGDREGDSTGANPAFEGPTGRGSNVSDDSSIELPCGHESFEPDEVPDDQIHDGKTIVGCSECGGRWGVEL